MDGAPANWLKHIFACRDRPKRHMHHATDELLLVPVLGGLFFRSTKSSHFFSARGTQIFPAGTKIHCPNGALMICTPSPPSANFFLPSSEAMNACNVGSKKPVSFTTFADRMMKCKFSVSACRKHGRPAMPIVSAPSRKLKERTPNTNGAAAMSWGTKIPVSEQVFYFVGLYDPIRKRLRRGEGESGLLVFGGEDFPERHRPIPSLIRFNTSSFAKKNSFGT